MTPTDEAVSALTALHDRPMTCRELTVKLCGKFDGRALWRIAGLVDRLHHAGLIVRCGQGKDGRPLYAA